MIGLVGLERRRNGFYGASWSYINTHRNVKKTVPSNQADFK